MSSLAADVSGYLSPVTRGSLINLLSYFPLNFVLHLLNIFET